MVKIKLVRLFKRKIKNRKGEKKELKGIVSHQAKLKILSLFSWLLALVIFLSFFDKAGIGGSYLLKFFVLLVGKGTLALPFVFLLFGAVLFRAQKKEALKPALISLFLLISGIAGFMASQDLELKAGGVMGYFLSWPLDYLFGFWVTLSIFLILILSSFIISKDLIFLPLREALEKLKEEKERRIEAVKEESLVAGERREKPKVKVPVVSKIIKKRDEKLSEVLTYGTKLKGRTEVKFKKSGLVYPLDLLAESKKRALADDIEKRKIIIKNTLANFGIEVEMGEVRVGPTVTQYTLKPAQGVKLSKITALSNNLALALASHPIRIEAPIPGKPLVGIEVPNRERGEVRLKDLLSLSEFQKSPEPMLFALGEDVTGKSLFADLEKMPHLLVAGATGSGKTIFLNSLILSLTARNTPENLRLILVDPKRVELSVYKNIPYILGSVITDVEKVPVVLEWLIREMEKRFKKLSSVGARNIASFNNKVKGREVMPYIVLIIDELADIMSAKGKEVEAGIVRLAQMARAVGIHLVLATQRPSVDIITGLIKANITSRIAFKVATQVDSRTILDVSGAEKLLGSGDALFISSNFVYPKRIQTPYISEKEVQRVVKWLSERVELFVENGLSISLEEALLEAERNEGYSFSLEDDELYEEAKKVVVQARKASASLLQRRLKIGYARAARLLDMLERDGIIGPQEGSKPRKVYIDRIEDISS